MVVVVCGQKLRQVVAQLELELLRPCQLYSPLITFQTLLVTGGWAISSTELLVETAPAWIFTGELPSPRHGLRGANIDNKVVMTGNNNHDNNHYN